MAHGIKMNLLAQNYKTLERRTDVAHAEGSVIIKRPLEVVFEFILDGGNNPLWRPEVLDIEHVNGTPLGIGQAFKQGLKGPGGSRIDSFYKIVDLKVNEMIKYQVTPGPTGVYTFEEEGYSTKVTLTLSYEPKGLEKLINSTISKMMQDQISPLENLKAYLESRPI